MFNRKRTVFPAAAPPEGFFTQETIAGGIVLPDTPKDKPREGTAVAAGPGRLRESSEERRPLEVRPGDRILFGSDAGEEVRVDGKDSLILNEDDIRVVLSKGLPNRVIIGPPAKTQ